MARKEDPGEIERAVRQVLEHTDEESNRVFGKNHHAWELLERLALETPELLRPHLRVLAGHSRVQWLCPAFRAADDETTEMLFSELASGDRDRRARAAPLLWQTRKPEVLRRLASHPESDRLYECLRAGYELGPAGLRRLYAEPPLFLALPPELVKGTARSDPPHPTWLGHETVRHRHRFGGRGEGPCAMCHGTLDHLLTLDPVPRSLGLSAERITISVCLSCVFEQNGEGRWRRTGGKARGVFFRHDEHGLPTPYDGLGERATPEPRSQPFVEAMVGLVDHGPRFWLSPSRSEFNHSRVGGAPHWLQDVAYDECPSCETTMGFLLQLDSDLPTIDGERYSWANGGMAYVSWCDACRVSHVELQYT
jgi:hypothetical protein